MANAYSVFDALKKIKASDRVSAVLVRQSAAESISYLDVHAKIQVRKGPIHRVGVF